MTSWPNMDDEPCAACGHIETAHDQENRYGEAVACHCGCPDFVKSEDDYS